MDSDASDQRISSRIQKIPSSTTASDLDSCTLRLYHIPSNTLITNENHQKFIAHGQMYDEMARLCMEYAQEVMMQEGNLKWTTVCSEREIGALVSRDRGPTNNNKKTLLVVTGKGKVGAGIFSRRLLITLGVEPATALPFVREAAARGMEIAMLDPNVLTIQRAMEVVETSLDRLFFGGSKDNIYVLAHSMAGSQLVRYLLNKATNASASTSTPHIDESSSKESSEDLESYLQQIKAVAFTDSNHNINWTKKLPSLTKFLVGPRSLYIKSHKVHEDSKALGEAHYDCQYWRHRFGGIRTLWAGTNEHALTNHTASAHIWEHFDAFLESE